MKQKLIPIPILAILFFAGCATNNVEPGSDPIVVNAQTTMNLAKATFDMIEKSEYDTYPAMKAANPELAAKIRTFVNNLRANQAAWLRTANNLKEAYRTSPSDIAYKDLQAGLAVLSKAIAEANGYMAQMGTKTTWMSPEMVFTSLNSWKGINQWTQRSS